MGECVSRSLFYFISLLIYLNFYLSSFLMTLSPLYVFVNWSFQPHGPHAEPCTRWILKAPNSNLSILSSQQWIWSISSASTIRIRIDWKYLSLQWTLKDDDKTGGVLESEECLHLQLPKSAKVTTIIEHKEEKIAIKVFLTSLFVPPSKRQHMIYTREAV